MNKKTKNKIQKIFAATFLLIGIIFISGCLQQKSSYEVVSIDYSKTYKVPQSRQVPFEFTIKNTGKVNCEIWQIWMTGFWGSIPVESDKINAVNHVEEILKPGEQKTYTLIGYVRDSDMNDLEEYSTIVKELKFIIDGCGEQKTIQKMKTLTK